MGEGGKKGQVEGGGNFKVRDEGKGKGRGEEGGWCPLPSHDLFASGP